MDGSTSGGIYTVQSGAWTLREDWANDTTKTGSFVYVSEGWYGGTAWVAIDFMSWDPAATEQVWGFQQMTGLANIYSSDQTLTVNGNDVSVNVAELAATHHVTRKFTQLVGDGSSVNFNVTHFLGGMSGDVSVTLKKVSTGEIVQATVVLSPGVASIAFNEAPATDSIKVIVIG
jgi:hypothetical protein